MTSSFIFHLRLRHFKFEMGWRASYNYWICTNYGILGRKAPQLINHLQKKYLKLSPPLGQHFWIFQFLNVVISKSKRYCHYNNFAKAVHFYGHLISDFILHHIIIFYCTFSLLFISFFLCRTERKKCQLRHLECFSC